MTKLSLPTNIAKVALLGAFGFAASTTSAITPKSNWADSYSANGKCYCATTFDHGIGNYKVQTPAGKKSVREICRKLGKGPGKGRNPVYNTVQCGHEPGHSDKIRINGKRVADEKVCPGRVDRGSKGCSQKGPKWDLSVFESKKQTPAKETPKEQAPKDNNEQTSSSDIPSGYVSIIAKHSKKCLDVERYSTANGGNLHQWACHGQDNQKFQFLAKDDGYYNIRGKQSKKCINIEGISQRKGANVEQQTCMATDSRLFKIIDKGDGYVEIKAKNSGQCIDVAKRSSNNGSNIQQWRCHGGDNQLFKLD